MIGVPDTTAQANDGGSFGTLHGARAEAHAVAQTIASGGQKVVRFVGQLSAAQLARHVRKTTDCSFAQFTQRLMAQRISEGVLRNRHNLDPAFDELLDDLMARPEYLSSLVAELGPDYAAYEDILRKAGYTGLHELRTATVEELVEDCGLEHTFAEAILQAVHADPKRVALRLVLQRFVEEASPEDSIQSQPTVSAVQQALQTARVVHIACHGSSERTKDGKESWMPGALVLSDGLLFASDITEMKIVAELVVLSCCDSAIGRVTTDGVSGLARAFLVAGAESVVMTQWPLDDDHTPEMMVELHHKLVGGEQQSIATCLTEVMRGHSKLPDVDVDSWGVFSYMGVPNKMLAVGKRQVCSNPIASEHWRM